MYHFFAYIARMKHIVRWGLMRNTREENIGEHSHMVAVVAHALALIGNSLYGKNYNAERVAVKGLYHEASEVITGDLATPIKYFNPEIKAAYKAIEAVANKKLAAMLPAELTNEYEQLLSGPPQQEDWKLVKYADKLCALMKCREELSSGNREFTQAEKAILQDIAAYSSPEVDYFMEHFMPSFSLTLDEMG